MAGTLEWSRTSNVDYLTRRRAGYAQGTTAAEVSGFTLREFLILAVLNEREMHGLDVVKLISATHEDFGVPSGKGVVYPLLKTLANDGLVRARQAAGMPRVYYSLTDQGRERLLAIARRWSTLNEAIQSRVGAGSPRSFPAEIIGRLKAI